MGRTEESRLQAVFPQDRLDEGAHGPLEEKKNKLGETSLMRNWIKILAFPFVPATWITGNFSRSSPDNPQRSRYFQVSMKRFFSLPWCVASVRAFDCSWLSWLTASCSRKIRRSRVNNKCYLGHSGLFHGSLTWYCSFPPSANIWIFLLAGGLCLFPFISTRNALVSWRRCNDAFLLRCGHSCFTNNRFNHMVCFVIYFCLLCTTRGSVSEMANRGCAILLSRYSRFDQVPEDYS